jgi:hypothetical protein
MTTTKSKLKSFYPPVCIQGPISEQWYIIADGKWQPVSRRYDWEELKQMWEKVEYTKTAVVTEVKKTYKVKGSKGNIYKVVNDGGWWNCSCPAHGFGRGKDCKHIKQIKDEGSKKTNKRKAVRS